MAGKLNFNGEDSECISAGILVSLQNPFLLGPFWSILIGELLILSLKLTASLHLKIDAWNTSFLLGWSIFRCFCR